MGLDMYLDKYPKYKDTTPQMVITIQNYLDWKDRCKDPDSKARNYSLKEWCGIDENEIPASDYIDFYSCFFTKKYSAYDVNKLYGLNRITEEIGYWRKANHIHNWFVENVQNGVDDCECYEVSKEKLEELLALCHKVKDVAIIETTMVACKSSNELISNYEETKSVVNKDEVAALLPTCSGFFFGGTEYDEWYMESINNTINIIDNVLNTTDFEVEVVFYESSW